MLIVIFSLIAIIIMMRMCAYALKQRSRERKIKTLKDNKVFWRICSATYQWRLRCGIYKMGYDSFLE